MKLPFKSNREETKTPDQQNMRAGHPLMSITP